MLSRSDPAGAVPVRKKKMSAPQTATIPGLSGIGANAKIQIPSVTSGNPTIVNLSPNLTITLCNDDTFAVGNTWQLGPNSSQPLPGVGTLFAQNPNTSDINVLVIDGVVPIFNPQTIGQGGLSVAVGTVTAPNTTGVLLPAPPSGFAYRLKYMYTAIGANGSDIADVTLFQVKPPTSGTPYGNIPFYFATGGSTTAPQSYQWEQLLVPWEILIGLGGTVTAGDLVNVYLFYDLVVI